MVSKYIPFIVVPLLMALAVVLFVDTVKERSECDQVIFLEGELSMDIRGVYSYDNGMSTIDLCDGKTLRVPTRRIIKIVDKDVQ
jgi:hypothetical protein